MLRLTDIKLPLDHDAHALERAILARLGIEAQALVRFSIAKRSYDARKRGAITLIYSVDVETRGDDAVLRRLHDDPRLQPTPDTNYRFVARAPERAFHRPIVIGTGPCGLFAGLLLAQMGLRPIILERGKAVRERTVCGASDNSIPNPTCSSAKAAPARSPTASSTARSAIRNTTAARY
jgi:uncharacterized FAD-dependent dehydrogenase